MIYFIVECSSNSAVKIGYTAVDPKKRMVALQTGNPNNLHLFAVIEGSERMEQWLHVMFRDYRLFGEWFQFSGPIKYYIQCALLSQKMKRDYAAGH